MASLRFTFDGERRPERPRPLPPFMARPVQSRPYMMPMGGYPREEEPVEPNKTPEEALPEKVTEREPEELKVIRDEIKQEQATLPPIEDNTQQKESSYEPKQEMSPLHVSEKFVAKLDQVETTLSNLRGHADTIKLLFDEINFKLDSFMQILEIIRANEERRVNRAQIQVASQKTAKDTVDEFLELLQTPVMQNAIRQLLINMLVKK